MRGRMSQPPSSTTLSIERAPAIVRFLEEIPSVIKSRGSNLAASQAVKSVEWDDTKKVLLATVQGSRLHHQEIRFGRKRIASALCSCPYSVDCKHCAAVLFNVFETFARDRIQQTTPLIKELISKSPAASVTEKNSELEIMVKELTGSNKLDREATQCLRTIHQWWLEKKRVLPLGDLMSLSSSASYWSSRVDTQLYPKGHPPKSSWELLHLVDFVMREKHSALPKPLAQVIDASLQERLVAEWEREKSLSRWKKTLATWALPHSTEPDVPVLRLRLHEKGAKVEWRPQGAADFTEPKLKKLTDLFGRLRNEKHIGLDIGSRIILQQLSEPYGYFASNNLSNRTVALSTALGSLIGSSEMRALHLADENGGPLTFAVEPLRWRLDEPDDAGGDYVLSLVDETGGTVDPPISITSSRPMHYVTRTKAWRITAWPFGQEQFNWPVKIPAAAFESREGVALLETLGLALPARIEKRVRVVRPAITVRCRLHQPSHARSEYFQLQAQVEFENVAPRQIWNGESWSVNYNAAPSERRPVENTNGDLVRIESTSMTPATRWISQWELKPGGWLSSGWFEKRIVGGDFPEQFLQWLDQRPDDVAIELDPELAGLRGGTVSGNVRLELEESGFDWFDLRVALDVNDLTLTQAEIKLLLKARGRWVRLSGKGWRKLAYDLTPEQEAELADLGLATSEFDGETQRLHALQLAGTKSGSGLLPPERIEEVRRRAQEIQTRVTPDLPASISATLRPYQTEGFHFLSYLTANRFGGILADDMGLGKTIQTLSWLASLRETTSPLRKRSSSTASVKNSGPPPVLVICPKSVQDNWRTESERFFKSLRVTVWQRANAGKSGLDGDTDLLVVHYQHLRLHEDLLLKQQWSVVILDEAQAIKNPSSQTHRIACSLRSEHRLALTGTPIENRLLDLWAIMAFAMPGALGSRSHFTRHFDAKADPFARRRLAARVRPFVLRRTKKEVAKDLPDRIEEDIICEIEGNQDKLYQAELKRARATMLKAKTSKQLDKLRFNILTSLLRLRQICCHPALVMSESDAKNVGSAKLDALMDLLEPIMQEGNKVLVFSQFTGMLDLIQEQVIMREWTHCVLTGATDDRGALVKNFQETEGSTVFLISLKAGGFGLNLTAASYVVLFDPWWNPAVEAQAIDRTHRIGQTQKVIAYRLLVKNSIEEKIRVLQKQKGAMANDVLGEENFAKALTLDDFQFLLGGEE